MLMYSSRTYAERKGTPTLGNVQPPRLHYLAPLIYVTQPIST